MLEKKEFDQSIDIEKELEKLLKAQTLQGAVKPLVPLSVLAGPVGAVIFGIAASYRHLGLGIVGAATLLTSMGLLQAYLGSNKSLQHQKAQIKSSILKKEREQKETFNRHFQFQKQAVPVNLVKPFDMEKHIDDMLLFHVGVGKCYVSSLLTTMLMGMSAISSVLGYTGHNSETVFFSALLLLVTTYIEYVNLENLKLNQVQRSQNKEAILEHEKKLALTLKSFESQQ